MLTTRRTGILAGLMRGAIRTYQLVLSPFAAGHCRFLPTCSAYADEAIDTHGAARGAWLTLRRLSRCHPLGGSGYDPVPPAQNSTSISGAGERSS